MSNEEMIGNDELDDMLDVDEVVVDPDNGLSPDAVGSSDDTTPITTDDVPFNLQGMAPVAQQVWFAKTSRTNLDQIYLKGKDHLKNPVCEEFRARLADGWRLHSMQSITNDNDVFIVMTRN